MLAEWPCSRSSCKCVHMYMHIHMYMHTCSVGHVHIGAVLFFNFALCPISVWSSGLQKAIHLMFLYLMHFFTLSEALTESLLRVRSYARLHSYRG